MSGGIPDLIVAEANAQGVPPELALGIWRAEGMPDMSAMSPKGAMGAMQLMPGTARDQGVDPQDLAGNIKGGVGYLKQQLATFKRPDLAAAAYNAGPGAVMAHGGVPPYPETQAYVLKATGGPKLGADIFGDAPAAGQAGDAPAGDGAEIFADGPTTQDPPKEAAPARQNPVVITNAETGEAYGDDVEGQYGKLVQAHQVDNRMPIGSREFPRAMGVDGGQPGPGEWYVDASGLHQAPGIAQHTLGGDLSGTVLHAFGRVGDDLKERPATNPDLGGFLKGLAQTARGAVTFPGDVLSAAVSPITGLLEGGAIQPLATQLDRVPVQQYAPGGPSIENGQLVFKPPQAVNGQEAHDASANMLRTAAGAAIPGEEGVPLAARLGGGYRGGMFGATEALKAAEAAPRTGMAPMSAGDLLAQRLAAAKPALVQAQGLRYAASKLPPEATPDTLRAADPRLTAAEAMGQRGELAVGALAKREGATADLLGDAAASRREARGDQVLKAFSDAAGIDPSATRGAIDKMVEQGQAEAEPIYAQAYEGGPIWNRRLGEIAQTPAGQDAMKQAHRLMRNEGEDPEALGMTFMDDPESWASYVPPPVEAEAAPVGFAGRARGPARPPSQGPSLLKFIADTGGIDDTAGDVAAMGGDRWHVGRAYQPKLIGHVQPDYVAQKAWEAGYFPQAPEPPAINDLYDAIGQELRGKALYARPADQASLDRFHRANADEELAYRGGDPADLPSPEQYVGRPAPRSGPVHEYVPNAKTWDYVKRALDDQLKPYTAGKLAWDNEGIGILKLKQDLVDQVAGLNPKYREALSVSGDYLSGQQAFEDGRKMIFDGRIDETDFKNRLMAMTPAQLRFFRAGIANKAYESVMTSSTQPTRLLNAIRTPLAAAKLKMAMGAKRAAALAQEIQTQARMKGFEDRYAPRTNSVTAEINAEIGNQDQQGAGRDLIATTVRNAHRGPVRAALAGFGHILDKGIRAAAMPGMSIAARDEAGGLLAGSPADMADALQWLRDQQAAPQRGKAARFTRGMIGFGVAGHTVSDHPNPPRGGQQLVPQR